MYTFNPSTDTHGNNTAVGYRAGFSNSTSENNTFMGARAGEATTGHSNTIIGREAALQATSMDESVVIGASACANSTVTGDNNVTVGVQAAFGMTSNSSQVAIGYRALYALGGGYHNNVAVGTGAMSGSTSGTNSVAVGEGTMGGITGGDYNTVVGNQAMGQPGSSRDVSHNTVMGYGALRYSNRHGDGNNVAIGSEAADTLTDGYNNVIIGAAADASGGSGVNQVVIGYGAVGQGNNYHVIGNGSTTRLYAGDDAGGTFYGAGQSWSDSRIKTNVKDIGLGLDFINKLEPIQYTKKQPKDYDDSLKSKLYPSGSERIVREIEETEIERIRPGFIAQDVLKTLEEFNFSTNNSMVQIDEDTTEHSMDYQSMVVPLVKAVQELSSEIENIKKTCKCMNE